MSGSFSRELEQYSSGVAVVHGPPFKICTPHFMFGPPVAAYIQYCILNVSPLSFSASPAAKSCWLLDDRHGLSPILYDTVGEMWDQWAIFYVSGHKPQSLASKAPKFSMNNNHLSLDLHGRNTPSISALSSVLDITYDAVM